MSFDATRYGIILAISKETDAMVARPVPMTAAELLALADDGRFELVEGEIRERVSPNYDHYRLVGRLNGFLFIYIEDRELGDVGPELHILFQIAPDTVLLPDIAYYHTDRVPAADQRVGLTKVVPDLVAEVLSPANTALEIDEKIQIYLRAGVRLVWIVNPKLRSVTIYAADGTVRSVLPGGVLDGGDILPGFALPVDRIFA